MDITTIIYGAIVGFFSSLIGAHYARKSMRAAVERWRKAAEGWEKAYKEEQAEHRITRLRVQSFKRALNDDRSRSAGDYGA